MSQKCGQAILHFTFVEDGCHRKKKNEEMCSVVDTLNPSCYACTSLKRRLKSVVTEDRNFAP